MEKTLQQQYQLINEGKGNKDHFLKQARNLFPELITSGNDYITTVHILKNKSILHEGVGGLITQSSVQPDWFKIFNENLEEANISTIKLSDGSEIKVGSKAKINDEVVTIKTINKVGNINHIIGVTKDGRELLAKGSAYVDPYNTKEGNLSEAVGVKDKKEYGDQNEFEKPAPEVAKDLANQFDNSDEKNIDNVYGQSFLMGYYTEMKDPKNKDKSVDELKQIVLKNMVKNVNYYATDASFGEKGIGYTTDVVGGGNPVEPKGKYKSSGYGDMPKAVKEGLNEAKRPSIGDHIKEVEKSSQAIALEAKMNAIDEAIEKRKAKLALAESEELAEMIDQSMVKTLNKEIKELEKHKAKTQKIYEKITGKAKEEMIDEDKLNENQSDSLLTLVQDYADYTYAADQGYGTVNVDGEKMDQTKYARLQLEKIKPEIIKLKGEQYFEDVYDFAELKVVNDEYSDKDLTDELEAAAIKLGFSLEDLT